ncbi:SAM-dependent methyltransferase [Candidatus Latescibacterota bacterium]
MPTSDDQLRQLLHNDRFPRSSQYDSQWVLENEMGPNALWLTEWLCEQMDLKAGMRVLDMGCGKCLSSIFLAREFDVQVWANDLWIPAEENWQRIVESGLEAQVFPMRAEARSLPYAHGFFDAIVCIDSYFYYGTDDLYLKYFRQFVRTGGQIGIVTPGLVQDIGERLPSHLVAFWSQDCWGWHTAEWWRRLWERTGLMDIQTVDVMPDGWRHWLQHYHARRVAGPRKPSDSDFDALEADQGQYVGLIRMVASRSGVVTD